MHALSKLVMLLMPEDVLDASALQASISEELERYSLEEVLGLAEWIDVYLTNAAGEKTSAKTQVEILNGLFGQEANAILNRIQDFERKHENAPVACFHRVALLNAVKCATLAGDGIRQEIQNESLAGFGRALFKLNTRVTAGFDALDLGRPEHAAAAKLWIQANLMSTDTSDLLGYGRAFEFLRIDKSLTGLLARSIEAAAGVDAFAYLAVIQGHAALFGSITVADLHANRHAIGVPAPSATGRTTRYARITNAVLRKAAWSLEEFVLACRERYGTDLRPYDFLEFERRPLVRVGSRLYCLDRGFLHAKAGLGILHAALDRPGMSRRESQDVLNYKGLLCNEYVRRVLTSMMDPARLIGPNAIEDRMGNRLACDFIIVDVRKIVLLEVKATAFKVDIRNGTDAKAYIEFFRTYVVEAVRQMASVWEELEAGWYEELVPGISGHFDCVPVLVTLDIQSEHLLYTEALNALEAAQIPRRFWNRLQILDLRDVERVEAFSTTPGGITGGLMAKTESFEERTMTVNEYLRKIKHSAAGQFAEFTRVLGKKAIAHASAYVKALSTKRATRTGLRGRGGKPSPIHIPRLSVDPTVENPDDACVPTYPQRNSPRLKPTGSAKKMPTVSSEIESRVQSFVAEISNLVRAAALEAVSRALGVGPEPDRRGRGRPKGSGNKAAAMPARPPRAGKRGRRSAADVEAAAQKMLAYVKANDGKRLDEIAKALGTDTASLKAPSLMLLASKAVKRSGQRRGTKYHLGGGAAKAAAPAKSAPAKKA